MRYETKNENENESVNENENESVNENENKNENDQCLHQLDKIYFKAHK